MKSWNGLVTELSPGPPPVDSIVTLWGLGPNDRLHKDECIIKGGARGCVESNGQKIPYMQNRCDSVRTIGGDSGGPVFDEDGRLCGVIMCTNGSTVGTASWRETSKALSQWGIRPGSPLPGTQPQAKSNEQALVFTTPGCQPCVIMKKDIDAGAFDGLGVDFEIVDSTERPDLVNECGVSVYPTLMYRGYLVSPSPQYPYSVTIVKQFIAWAKGQPDKGQPKIYKATPTPPVQSLPNPFEVTPPKPPAPVEKVEAPTNPIQEKLSTIDWTGVRFGVLVSADASPFIRSGALLGPVQKALDSITGGMVAIEIFDEVSHPERYSYIKEVLEVDGIKVYPFATVDKVMDVGFARGMILGKIEGVLDGKIGSEDIELVPDLIFRRNNQKHWKEVTDAMGGPIPALSAEERNKSWVETLIAFFTSLITSYTAGTHGRGIMSYFKERRAAIDA